eukprot:7386209-Prymnesium_polylepis.1
MPIVEESDSVQAFVDDPARRLERVAAVSHALRPTYQQMATVARALEHNPFVSALRTWSQRPIRRAISSCVGRGRPRGC